MRVHTGNWKQKAKEARREPPKMPESSKTLRNSIPKCVHKHHKLMENTYTNIYGCAVQGLMNAKRTNSWEVYLIGAVI